MSAEFKKMLAERIQKNRRRLWDWYARHAAEAPPPFYCSIDLRDAGYKVVPVDSNLYPAGFNNICPEDRRAAPPVIRKEIEAVARRLGHAEPKKILVLPESHTTNAFYIENLHYLTELLENAGFEVKLGWYGSQDLNAVTLKSANDKQLTAFPIEIQEGRLSAAGFTPDLILLNNDFSSGYPKALDAVKQPIVPSHTLGWHTRKKTHHFVHYNRLAREFAEILGIDPWLVQIETEEVAPVDFNEEIGLHEVAASVDRVLAKTRKAYEERKISRRPFAFIKNNAGTYGMGIMVVHSGEDVLHLNRRAKNKMSVGKNRMQIQSVAVQEGVPTATLVDRLAAEPVIYLFGSELMGGFLRTNTEKSDEENLNSAGMVFRKLCMSDLKRPDDDNEEKPDDEEPVLELVYGSIARISALAAGKELAGLT